MKWVGHRGCGFAVENTKEAYLKAIELGVQYLECDVRVSKDKVFFISHDNSFYRLCNSLSSEKFVEEYTEEEIRMINLTQTRNGKTYNGKVCFLEEYLNICKEHNVHAILDIKWSTGLNPNDISMYKELINLLKKTNMYDNSTLLMSTCLAELDASLPRQNCISYIRSFDKTIDISLLANKEYESYYDFCVENNVWLDINLEKLTEEMITYFHNHNLKVNVWTVNNKEDAKKYISWGVDFITTDVLMND